MQTEVARSESEGICLITRLSESERGRTRRAFSLAVQLRTYFVMEEREGAQIGGEGRDGGQRTFFAGEREKGTDSRRSRRRGNIEGRDIRRGLGEPLWPISTFPWKERGRSRRQGKRRYSILAHRNNARYSTTTVGNFLPNANVCCRERLLHTS